MDKKALNILRKYYINWRNREKTPTEAEWDYCISKGVFYETEKISHDEMYSELKEFAEIISIEDTAKAFLYSLSSGDVRYRTALSSLLWAKSLYEHEENEGKIADYNFSYHCTVCGCKCNRDEVDWNLYNAWRMFPGAGVNPDYGQLEYALFDLREFYKLEPVEPSEDDYYILNRIFGTIKKATSANKANAVIKMIKQENILDVTADEIHALLGVLSMCSVLETDTEKGYLHSFTNAEDREFMYEKDYYYPLNFWRGNDGINYEAVEEIFGSFSADRLCEENSIATDTKAEKAQQDYLDRQKKSLPESNFRKDGFIINLTSQERKYLALNDISPDWEKTEIYSKSFGGRCFSRFTCFYDGDVIVKYIHEEYDYRGCLYQHYLEADTNLKTDSRKMLLPLTKRGHQKPVTASNVMAIMPFGCEFDVWYNDETADMCLRNARNNQHVEIEKTNQLKNIRSESDFHEFMNWYISTCPPNYMDKVREMKTLEKQTIRYKVGDIFRCEHGRNNFCYGLIIGKIADMKKWKEFPENHTIREQMGKPILVRLYDFVTDNPNMTPEELENIPLRPSEYCMDNDIIWNVHKIVGHKKLTEDDILFPLVISRGMPINPTAERYINPNLINVDHFDAYVEWGTAQLFFKWNDIPQEIGQLILLNCGNYPRGTSFFIMCDYCGKTLAEILEESPGNVIKDDILLPENKNKLRLAMKGLGLSENAGFDEFAVKFGGMTRKEYLEKIIL